MGRRRKHPKFKQTKPKWYQTVDEWGNFVFDWTLGLKPETWREIFAAIILIISVVISLGFFGSAGSAGLSFSNASKKLFGPLGAYLFNFLLYYIGLILLLPSKEKHHFRISRFLGVILALISFSTLSHLFVSADMAKEAADLGHNGGTIGYTVSILLREKIGLFPAFLTSVFCLVISILMTFNFSITGYLGLNKEEDEEKEGLKINDKNENRISVFELVRKRINAMRHGNQDADRSSKAPVMEVDAGSAPLIRKDSTWEYPPLDILKSTDEAPNPGNINKNVETIRKCLGNFGIKIEMHEANVGPTVTQYTFKPEEGEGIKLNQIVARQTDLALALSAKSLRMEAPIPGKSSVGIEIPNVIPAKVTLREVIKSKEFRAVKSKLALSLGRDVSGDSVAVDLEKMPHVLIAGSTGSGKSVCINSLICSLLFNNSPRDLRLILVDPKRVELTNYNGIPHLLTPVITEVNQTVSALKWAVWEMERRYKIFSELGRRNIIAYNEAPGAEGKLPYIVIVIDELADLMASSAKEVEGSIVRIAQMARATGMHLIIATQRPSVDVLTGLIKANITSRIAFATASQVDSRTILDLSGAEKLLGNGDMLFIGNGLNKPRRIQGCFVSDAEIEEINKFLRDKDETLYDDAILSFRSSQSGKTLGNGNGTEDDELYNEAVETVMHAGKASASLLQRRLRVGYARAARLLDILEQQGIIGPSDGAKPRDILISDPGSMAFQSRGEHISTDNSNQDKFNNNGF